MRFLLLGWLLLLPAVVMAQNFEISGESSLTGSFTLTVFDGDSTSHSYTAKANKGLFLFSGRVANPVLASIQHPAMQAPLYFYLENSPMSIKLNATRPDASLIKGSRTNSEYRYLMERFLSAPEPATFLKQYARENSASIFTPFILHRQMSRLDDGAVRQIIGLISGEATHTYHYTLLRRWIHDTPAVSEGSEMPDFAYLDSQKKRHLFSETRNLDGATLIFFGANWCDRCKTQYTQASRLADSKQVSLIPINIDDNPNGWDANYLKQLAIDHIPFMILVNADGIVTARDIRIWELKQAL